MGVSTIMNTAEALDRILGNNDSTRYVEIGRLKAGGVIAVLRLSERGVAAGCGAGATLRDAMLSLERKVNKARIGPHVGGE